MKGHYGFVLMMAVYLIGSAFIFVWNPLAAALAAVPLALVCATIAARIDSD